MSGKKVLIFREKGDDAGLLESVARCEIEYCTRDYSTVRTTVRFDPERHVAVVSLGDDKGCAFEPIYVNEIASIECAINERVPVLGICHGAQALAYVASSHDRSAIEENPLGVRGKSPPVDFGLVRLLRDGLATDPIVRRVPYPWELYQNHTACFRLPPGARPLAFSAMRDSALHCDAFVWQDIHYGFQFHPEVKFSWLQAQPFAAGESPERLRAVEATGLALLVSWWEGVVEARLAT
ncbi:hypothetical protein J0H58_13160 [bacterium]|nr:hypothetical protein [bacterium]